MINTDYGAYKWKFGHAYMYYLAINLGTGDKRKINKV